jgi:hypothetical protein
LKYYCKLNASAVGCCPSEAEIQEILVAAEDEETSGSVKLDRFLSTVSHIIQEKRSVSKLMPVKPPPLRGLNSFKFPEDRRTHGIPYKQV